MLNGAESTAHGSGKHDILKDYLLYTYNISTIDTPDAIRKGHKKLSELEAVVDIPDNLDELIEASEAIAEEQEIYNADIFSGDSLGVKHGVFSK